MPEDDKDIFNRAESDLRKMQSELQLTTGELITIFLLIFAKDAAVPLPDTFNQLTANYADFRNGRISNDEKNTISVYLGRIGSDLETLQYSLCTKIAEAKAIAGIQSAIATPLPPAPYIPPPPKKPNPPVTGLAVTLSASATTGTTGVAITLTATAVVPPGRAVTKVEFYEGATLLGQDTTTPHTFSYTPTSTGTKSITARAYDDSPTPIMTVSNVIAIVVSAPAIPIPAVTVTAPTTATTGSSVTLSATASSTDGIASVQFRVNEVNLNAPDTTTPYSTNWTVPSTPGTYTITAIATGTQGGTATSAAVAVTVTGPPPTATKLTPTNITATGELGGQPATNAVDGNTSTSWTPVQTDNGQFIQFDLGQSHTITKVVLVPLSGFEARINRVDVLIGNDVGLTDGTVYGSTPTTVTTTITLEPGASQPRRYVRIKRNDAAPNNNLTIAEVEIWGYL